MKKELKVIKSNNPMAGQYFYRGVYISKDVVGNSWYARCADLGVEIPRGLTAKTRSRLIFLIDRALK